MTKWNEADDSGSDSNDDILDLLEEARCMPRGEAQIAAFDEAVALADSRQNESLSYECRIGLIEACTFFGRPDKALVAFAWCLASFDKTPEKYDEWDLLWKYKWVLASAAEFPQVSRAKIEEMRQDLCRRYNEFGVPPRAPNMLHWILAAKMGDLDLAKDAYEKFRTSPRDAALADCAACEQNHVVDYFYVLGDDAEVVRAADVIFKKKMSCAEVPHVTYGYVLWPLLRLGEVERAMECHKKGYRLAEGNPEFLRTQAAHLTFAAATGNLDRAVKIFRKHAGQVWSSVEVMQRFHFDLHGLFFLDLLAESGAQQIKLKFSETAPIFAEDGVYRIADVRQALADDAQAIGRRFDDRNGNDKFARLFADLPNWRQYVCSFPA